MRAMNLSLTIVEVDSAPASTTSLWWLLVVILLLILGGVFIFSRRHIF